MKNAVIFSIKLAVTAGILFAIAYKLDIRTVLSAISGLSVYGIIAALLFILLQILVSAVRLSLIVRLYGQNLSVRETFRITLEGLFFAQTFISFLGSDSVRVWRLHRQGATLSEAAAAITLDRLLGIIVNHAALLASLPFAFSVISDQRARLALSVLAIAGVAGVAVVIILGMLRGRTGASEQLMKRLKSTAVLHVLLEMASVGVHLMRLRSELVWGAVMSVAIVLLNCAIFFAILSAWAVPPLTAFKCAILVPAVLEIAMLPISIAGWGIREGIVIFAFGLLGVAAPIAFGTSLVYALLLLGVGLIGGALWLLDRQVQSAPTH